MKPVALLIAALALGAHSCEYNQPNDETRCYSYEFQKGDTIALKKYGSKVDMSLVRGPLFADSFGPLPGIKEVTIGSSNISRIEPGFFAAFTNLTTLTIKINHGFPDLSAPIFKGCCPHLTTFKVYDNNFRNIDNAILKTMPLVETLWIERQFLGPIGPHYFAAVPHLKKLSVQHGQVKQIDPSAFADLGELVKLELQYNQLEKIQDGTFKHLKKLEELYLNGNSIRDFSGVEFEGLLSLKRLELIGNRINSVNLEKVLENLPKLEKIGIQLTLIECDRAKVLLVKLKERNVEIKNDNEVLSAACRKTIKE